MPASSDTPVLIITGPPGVGKTTIAEILAARSARAVHLEADAFFRFIRTDYIEPWRPESAEQNRVVMSIAAKAAAGYAAAGYFTIVDGIVLPHWFLEPMRDALRDAGHNAAYAVLQAPLSVCMARVEDREGGELVDPEVIVRLWRDFADLGERERYAVDVGGMTAEEAADALAQRLAAGLLAI